MTDKKKIIENNFDRMREAIKNTWLPINVGDTTVGETTLREGDVFRLATALINEGFRLEREGEWKTMKIGDGEKVRTCSSCLVSQSVNVYKGKVMFRYCPYCGARMIKE